MGEQPTKDLVVLVADQDMHEAMGELLQRTEESRNPPHQVFH